MGKVQVSAARGMVCQLCPRCREGKIFRRSGFLLPGMHERCPACGLKFEREEGYFLGAMYIGYGLALAAISLLALLLWASMRWPRSAVEKGRIKGHCHAHRRAAVAGIGGTLKEEPRRGDIPGSKKDITARHESSDLVGR